MEKELNNIPFWWILCALTQREKGVLKRGRKEGMRRREDAKRRLFNFLTDIDPALWGSPGVCSG